MGRSSWARNTSKMGSLLVQMWVKQNHPRPLRDNFGRLACRLILCHSAAGLWRDNFGRLACRLTLCHSTAGGSLGVFLAGFFGATLPDLGWMLVAGSASAQLCIFSVPIFRAQ